MQDIFVLTLVNGLVAVFSNESVALHTLAITYSQEGSVECTNAELGCFDFHVGGQLIATGTEQVLHVEPTHL